MSTLILYCSSILWNVHSEHFRYIDHPAFTCSSFCFPCIFRNPGHRSRARISLIEFFNFFLHAMLLRKRRDTLLKRHITRIIIIVPSKVIAWLIKFRPRNACVYFIFRYFGSIQSSQKQLEVFRHVPRVLISSPFQSFIWERSALNNLLLIKRAITRLFRILLHTSPEIM